MKKDNNIAIYLDPIKSKETSTINEFLFSFLRTKFYISKDIKLFIEIPNFIYQNCEY